MKETDIIYSVRDIFEHQRFKGITYRIPDYQRGYKWTPDNVRALLNDVWNFNGKEEQFYCLQNITIILSSDGKYFNVIDGQQRLTTLSIVLSYLNEQDLVKKRINYEIRKTTATFLEEHIFSRKCWEDGYKYNPQHQDEYYIMSAAETVAEWFENTKVDSSAFKEKLLSRTKLIVNEVTSNEYQTFSNLNNVRIPLDASDLIRAMMVTYSVKEGKENVDIDPYRVRMGAEIDSFTVTWSNPELKRYYCQFLPEDLSRKARELRFDYAEHPINLLYLLFLLQKKGEESISLSGFEEYLKNEPDAFSHIKEFDAILQEWYNDNALYHYLGFLFFNYKSRVKFTEIFKLWLNCSSRTAFRKEIKKTICECIMLDFKPSEQEKIAGKTSLNILLASLRFNLATNWYTHPALPQILILNDILTAVKSNSLGRIPVSYFKINNEDREHISCQTPTDKELNNKERWIQDLQELENFELPDNDREKFLSNISSLKTEIERADEITNELKEKIIDSLTQFGLNSIGNIVLLNLSVNRGYGNSPFMAKRLAISNNYFNNKTNDKQSIKSKNAFIRPFTMRTFLSNLDGTDIRAEKNNWTLADIKSNAENIASSVESFINETL